MPNNKDQLIAAAKKVRDQAHAPYSGFLVGAALQDEQGNLYIGCNVENSSLPEGNCAETSAIGAMVAAGGRKIVTIAVVGGHTQLEACAPCGGCRQRIREFADVNTRIIALEASGEFVEYGIDDLLPKSFQLK
jgi:cytidine deaminase